MRARSVACWSLCMALAGAEALAQDAAVVAVDAGAAGAVADAGAGAPGPVDPTQPMPQGHPPVGDDPHGGAAVRRASGADAYARESSALPAGVVVVRVVDAQGAPQPDVMVRVGAMREGEAVGAQEIRTGPDGTARIEGMIHDGSAAYRLSTDHRGARSGAPPFQLGPTAGYEVQIVRHEVTGSPRGVLLWEARAEVRFKDDRAVVVMRLKVVNLSGLSLDGTRASPTTFVPAEGLRFGLPPGAIAFTAQPSMSDLRVAEEGGAAVVRGSIPPTASEPTEIVYQYQLKLQGGDVTLDAAMPLPVVNAMVAAEAPTGLTLSVDGMPAPQLREAEGQRVLVTALERRPDDPQLASLRIRLGGIPSPAGPGRVAAAAVAALLVLGSLGYAVRGRAPSRRSKDALAAERARVLDEMRELARMHAEGEVGPVTYERRRRELTLWMASLLQEAEAAG